MSDAIKPFVLDIPQTQLDDLDRRLAATRWPERETVEDWSQAPPPEPTPETPQFHWKMPESWTAVAPGQMQVAKFSVPAHRSSAEGPRRSRR